MSIENIRIAKSALTDTIYAGYTDKSGITWKTKKDVTDDFLAAVIDRFSGFSETITCSDGKTYEIQVKEIK